MRHSSSRSPFLALVLVACGLAVATPELLAAPDAKAPDKKAPSKSAKPALSKLDASATNLLREKAISAAEKLANSTNAEIRANALEACGNVPDRLKTTIQKGLKDTNQGVRTVAAMTIGKRKIKDLTADVEPLLKDESAFARAASIYALTANGQAIDQTPLANILLHDPSPRVRAHAAFIVGEIGNKSAMGLLRQATREKLGLATEAESKAFQLQVSEAMVKLGDAAQTDTIRAALYGSPEELETAALAAQILGQLKDRGAIAHLTNLSMYKDKSGNRVPPDVGLTIAMALCRLGEADAANMAMDHLTEPTPLLRKQVTAVLGASGKPEYLATLEQMLGDAEESVQIAAADAILKITEKRP